MPPAFKTETLINILNKQNIKMVSMKIDIEAEDQTLFHF